MAGRAGKGRRSWFRIITGVMMALVCAVLLYQFWLFGLVVWYKYQNPGASAVMREEYARLSEGHADFRLQHEWVPYDKISNSLKRAVVAAEDSNFTEHDGVEWEAIRKAWEYNQKQEEAGRSKRAAAPPSPSSWPRTCSCRVRAAMCARVRNWS